MHSTLCWILLTAALAWGQPKRVLFITYSAGFRHDSVPTAIEVLRDIAAQSGRLEVVASEDLSLLSGAGLHGYDALFFFTSGELPISDSQKQDMLAFVRGGKGFGGVHSATDTLYTWPQYGDLIGARFNGHPWAQSVRINIEDPAHPTVSHLKPSFSISDEIYQFRDLSRNRVHVLMSLDTTSVDLNAPGVNPGTQDFPLAWVRTYGNGRVFYTALGHPESTWRDDRFQQMLTEALLWLTGQVDGAAPVRPTILSDAIGNSASFTPRMAISAGSMLSIFGEGLTSGAVRGGDVHNPPNELAGTTVRINDTPIPLLYVSPMQVNAFVPLDLQPRPCTPGSLIGCIGFVYDLALSVEGASSTSAKLLALDSTPGIFTLTRSGPDVTLWGTGFGPVEKSGDYQVTRTQPLVTVAGFPARVLFSGLSPGTPGLY